MRRFLLLALVSVLALSSFAQKKKDPKQEIPDQVLVAQYVYVTGWHGDLYDLRTPPEERTAISRVESAVQAWGRYKLVYHPDEADIMLVVKPGHLGVVGIGGGVGMPPDIGIGTPPPSNRQPGSVGNSIGYGAEAGNPSDYLLVSTSPKDDPVQAPYIWRRGATNGFQGRKIPLLEEFKQAVSDSDKAMSARKKP